jgi:hypothetical protein
LMKQTSSSNVTTNHEKMNSSSSSKRRLYEDENDAVEDHEDTKDTTRDDMTRTTIATTTLLSSANTTGSCSNTTLSSLASINLFHPDPCSSSSHHPEGYTVHDVLCGRGKVSLVHEGNKFFRETIEQCIDAYIYATNQPERSQVIQSVIDTIHNTGGQFKKKTGYPPKYITLPNQQCREKVRFVFVR